MSQKKSLTDPTAPTAIKLLSEKFQESDYDLKWLMSTICQTEAYGRASRPRRVPTDAPFTANVPQRLRSDQLLNAIYTALEMEETEGVVDESEINPRRRMRIRYEFGEVFGYDPSVAREEVGMSIPQVLTLMNSPRLNRLIRSRQSSLLLSLLQEVKNDEELIVELYLRWLCRQPSAHEISQVLAYRQAVGRRRVAFEDLQWALVNSAEFQHRR